MRELTPAELEPERCGPRSYADTHALGKRRLAAYLSKLCAKLHMQLGHAHADPEAATLANPTRHTWRFCQCEPCLPTRLLLEDIGCRNFLELMHQAGTRAERRKRRKRRPVASWMTKPN